MSLHRRRHRPVQRDELPTPFTPILEQLLRSTAGTLGVAFVDAEGETVDYAGVLDPFVIKVAAAHLRIILHEAERLGVFGSELREVRIRSDSRSFLIRALREGYAIVLLLPRRAFSVSRRALQVAERALSREAALHYRRPRPPNEQEWYKVDVQSCPDEPVRPGRVRISAGWEPLEMVLGVIADLPTGERGFRVRLRSGVEMTLIREPHSNWYTDEPA